MEMFCFCSDVYSDATNQFSRHQLGILTIQFWHSLPRVSVRSHKLKGVIPTVESSKPPVLLAGYESEGPATLSTSLIICYNSSQNSGKQFSYVFWFIIKYTVRNSSMEEMHRAGYRRGAHWATMAFLAHHPPSNLTCSLTWSSLTFIVQEFL